MDAAAARQLNDNLLPIWLRSNLRVFLCDKYVAKEPSHQFVHLSALGSNDVSIAQHCWESAEDKVDKSGHPFCSNSPPKIPLVFARASRIVWDEAAN